MMLGCGIRAHWKKNNKAKQILRLLGLYIILMGGLVIFEFFGHWITLLYILILGSIFG